MAVVQGLILVSNLVSTPILNPTQDLIKLPPEYYMDNPGSPPIVYSLNYVISRGDNLTEFLFWENLY